MDCAPPPTPRETRAARALIGLLLVALGGHLGGGVWRALGAPRGPPPRRLRVDIARDDVGRLACLPGIGPVRARAIAEARLAWGPEPRLEDLLAVAGIGQGTVARLAATRLAEVRLGGRPLGVPAPTMAR